MYSKALLSSALVLALGAGNALAQGSGDPLEFERTEPTTRVGTRGANFLQIGVGARAQALGGAFTALAEGPTALYWNSAATATAEGFAAAFSYTELFSGSDITHNFVGAMLPTALGTIGASVITLSSGPMTRTTEDYPTGGDPFAGGSFEWTATAVGLHYARQITDRLSVGAAGKVVTEGIAGANATFYGADLSTIFDTGMYGITVGATLANIGTSARMEGRDVRERIPPGDDTFDNRRITDVELMTVQAALPTTVRFGIMADLLGSPRAIWGANPRHALRVMTDLNDAIDTDLQTSIAAEYSFGEMVFLRGGRRWYNEARADHRDDFSFGLTAGAGLRIPLGDTRRLGLDYAWANMGDLNHNQIFSIEITF
jgi:hypothetical protein